MSLEPAVHLGNALAADANALASLKAQARDRSPQAIRETARQFESLFMRELIKSMREATLKSGLLDNPGSDLGTDLLDQQYAVQMAGQPGGLSDLIAAQLARQMGVDLHDGPTPAPTPPASPMSALQRAASVAVYDQGASQGNDHQARFVASHTATAQRIERETGLPASYLIGQAGHETGWGQHPILLHDGTPSNNLFGIKADAGWKGPVAEVTTTEIVNGVARKQVGRFRAYASPQESFRDYARLVTQSPRYAKVAQNTATAQEFADSLQRAGYATDPHYAVKLSRAIETTQRLQQRLTLVASAS